MKRQPVKQQLSGYWIGRKKLKATENEIKRDVRRVSEEKTTNEISATGKEYGTF